MTTAADIITSALQNLGVLADGEIAEGSDASMALIRLNRMLAQLSAQSLMVPWVTPVVFDLIGGKQSYTIGTRQSDTNAQVLGHAGATRTLTITSVTKGAVALGQEAHRVGDTETSRPVITAINPNASSASAGGVTYGAGTYTMSKVLTWGVTPTPIDLIYQRPQKINNAIVRVSGLDYPVAVISQGQWTMLGNKSLAGPWPRAVYYQPVEPGGIFHFWPVPSQGRMILNVETQLQAFPDPATNIELPPGYEALLEWGLSRALVTPFGKQSDSALISIIQGEFLSAREIVKANNRRPYEPARTDMPMPQRANDAGFILTGGF